MSSLPVQPWPGLSPLVEGLRVSPGVPKEHSSLSLREHLGLGVWVQEMKVRHGGFRHCPLAHGALIWCFLRTPALLPPEQGAPLGISSVWTSCPLNLPMSPPTSCPLSPMSVMGLLPIKPHPASFLVLRLFPVGPFLAWGSGSQCSVLFSSQLQPPTLPSEALLPALRRSQREALQLPACWPPPSPS